MSTAEFSAETVTGTSGKGKGDRTRLERRVRRMEQFAYWLDQSITVPGINYKIGVEPIIGLIPGVGDAVGAVLSGSLVFSAWRMGARKSTLFKCLWYVGVETLIGAIPVLGDLFDFGYKANMKITQAVIKDLKAQAELSQDHKIPEIQ